jgi:hypothetical protein
MAHKKPKGKAEESEEPEEWKRFKELARKVMNTPPLPRHLRKARPQKAKPRPDAH